VFPSYAAPGADTFFSSSINYIADAITLTYENGITRTDKSYAIIRPGADFTGVQTGEDFYNKFCVPQDAVAAAPAEAPAPAPPTAPAPAPAPPTVPPPPAPTIDGYPMPIIRDNGTNVTSGYFLTGTGYDDVAVLAVSAFAPEGDFDNIQYLVNYQQVLAQFLVQCKQANKKRLVIDVLANGGGNVIAGYELFAQVCPPPSHLHTVDMAG
jgi:hypothetical protein